MTTLELIEKHGIVHNCLSDAYELGRQDAKPTDDITKFLQYVADNADNEEFKNNEGWSMADLIELSVRYDDEMNKK